VAAQHQPDAPGIADHHATDLQQLQAQGDGLGLGLGLGLGQLRGKYRPGAGGSL